MTRTHPRRRLRALGPAILATAALLLVACEGGSGGDDSGQDPTPTRTAVGTRPSLDATPTGTAAASDGTSSSSGAVGSTDGVGFGVATVDVESGEVILLHEGASAFRPPLESAISPQPEARNGGVWVSVADDESVRYALDGAVEDRVRGWGVIEAPGALVRSYYAPTEGGSFALVVERDRGERHEVEGATASNRAFSPDGRWLAWLDASSSDTSLVMLMDIESGAVTELAEVTPSAGDGYHYIEWSPSGRFLAYEDPHRTSSARRGVYLYDTRHPEADRQRIEGNAVTEGWIAADEGEAVLTLRAQSAVLTPARRSEVDTDADLEPLTLPTGSTNVPLRARTLQGLVRVTRGDQPQEVTMIFDPVSGERVRELRGTSDAVLTPTGIATATITRNDIACTGIEVDHPALEQTLDCTADDLRWSPDGRFLALIPQSQSAPVSILDAGTGRTSELPHAGPRGTVPEWSEDGRYLVWVWGTQP